MLINENECDILLTDKARTNGKVKSSKKKKGR